MKRLFAIFLAICLLLSACVAQPQPTEAPTETTRVTEAPTEPPTTAPPPTEAPTDPPETVPPTEPPILYPNPLTGEENGKPATDRAFAVVINNIRQATPQHGISQADMIFEILAEGGVTRCMALFSDLSDVEKLGSIRSARTYFISLAQAFDSILVHVGGSTYAYNDFKTTGWPHLDALSGSSAAYFYRDQGRLNAGYAYEHTLFTSGPSILTFAEKRKLDIVREDGVDYGLTFAGDGTPVTGEAATDIQVRFRKGGKLTQLVFNQETGKYDSYEYNKEYIDGNTGEGMAFTNVLVLQAAMTTDSAGYRVFYTLTGSGKGYFACGGKIVPIKWQRSGATSPFAFTLKDGTPLTLGQGTSYVAIVPNGSPLEYT